MTEKPQSFACDSIRVVLMPNSLPSPRHVHVYSYRHNHESRIQFDFTVMPITENASQSSRHTDIALITIPILSKAQLPSANDVYALSLSG